MLSEQLVQFLEVNDVDPAQIKGVNFKIDEKSGFTVYVNLKRKGNNSIVMPFEDDEERAKRVFNELGKMVRARYTAYSKALKALKTL